MVERSAKNAIEKPRISVAKDESAIRSIREHVMTRTKWKPEQFRNKRFTKGWKEGRVEDILGWDNLKEIVKDAASRKL